MGLSPRIVLPLVTLLASLTGCLANNDSAASGATGDNGEGGAAPASGDGGGATGNPAAFAVRFGETDTPMTLWANGSFEARNAERAADAAPGSKAVDGGSFRIVDVTDNVPRGVPVTLSAEVRADLSQGDLDLWPAAPPGEIWSARFDAPYGGNSRFDALLVHETSEPLQVMLRYDVLEPGGSFDYSLEITIRPHATLLPGGLAAALPLEPGGAVAFNFTDDAEGAAVLVWDPQDDLIARVIAAGGRAEVALPEAAPGGEYVIMTTAGAPHAEVTVRGAHEPLRGRPLTKVLEFGEPHDIPPQGGASWSFEAPVTPIQVAFVLENAGATLEPAFTLTGPEGSLLTYEASGLEPWIGPSSAGWATPVGTEGLLAGAYEVAFTADAAAGASARHVIVTYGR